MFCNFTLCCRLLSIKIKVSGIRHKMPFLRYFWWMDMLRFRDIDQKLLGVTFDQWRPIWLVEFTVLLCFIWSFLNCLLDSWNWKTNTYNLKTNLYVGQHINVIISGTTEIVRVQFVYPWATNNTFPLVKLDTTGQLVRLEDLAPKLGNRTSFFIKH